MNENKQQSNPIFPVPNQFWIDFSNDFIFGVDQ